MDERAGHAVFRGRSPTGLYIGIRVPAFIRLPGTVFSLGGQTAPAPNWELGVQMVGANGVRLNANPYFKGPELSTTGALASAAWTTPGRAFRPT